MRYSKSAGRAASTVLVASAFSGLVLCAPSAFSQSITDPFNLPNVTITSHSGTVGGTNDQNLLTDPIYNGFGGAITNNGSAAGEGNDRFVFSDINTFPAFINFTIASPGAGVGIAGVTVYEAADGGEGASRGALSFSLLADVNNDSVYETTLVSGVNPVDNATGNTYNFAATAATHFRAEFTPNAGVQFPGTRVIELDGIPGPIPEPTSFGLLILGGAALSLRRKQTRRA